MKSLAILGAGGHGRVIADVATQLGWRAYLFDDGVAPNTVVLDWTVVGGTAQFMAEARHFEGAIIAIGENTKRLCLTRKLIDAGGKPATLAHPSATISAYASIGPGSVVMPQAVVMTGVRIGCAAIINTAASVDHDCLLGAGVHISPGARLCGNVSIADLVWIGAGATVIPSISIGAGAIVGAGTLVARSVGANITVMGNPARPRKEN